MLELVFEKVLVGKDKPAADAQNDRHHHPVVLFPSQGTPIVRNLQMQEYFHILVAVVCQENAIAVFENKIEVLLGLNLELI